MKTPAALPFLLLSLAGCEAPPPATLKAIPEIFVGQWDDDPSSCGKGGPFAVTILPNRVSLANSRAEVTGVAPDGRRAARIDGRFESTTGAKWKGSIRLELDAQRRVLQVVDGSKLVPRLRCPRPDAADGLVRPAR